MTKRMPLILCAGLLWASLASGGEDAEPKPKAAPAPKAKPAPTPKAEPKPKPKAIDVTIGMRNWACREVSNNNGVSPAIVVSEVSSTARRRWQAASTRASFTAAPVARMCL